MTACVKWDVFSRTTFSSRDVMVCYTVYLLSVHMGHAPLNFCFLGDHVIYAFMSIVPLIIGVLNRSQSEIGAPTLYRVNRSVE